MIDFYFYPTSPPCRAIILTARTIGLDMNYKELPVLTMEHITPELLKFVYSRPMMAYLMEKYGKDDSLYPKDLKKRAVINQRLFFDAIYLYPAFVDYFLNRTDERDEKVDNALELLNTFLEGQDHVAGKNLTIADFSIVVTINMIEVLDYSLSGYKNIIKWLTEIKSEIPKYEEIECEPLKIIKRRAYGGFLDETNRLKNAT
nr:glutathione S-transferase D1-like [Nomia melanderi]